MALMILVFFAAFSVVVMWLWNWLFPEIFNLPTITIWQAAGILLLSKIIFGFGKKGYTNLLTRALKDVDEKCETIPDPVQIEYHLPNNFDISVDRNYENFSSGMRTLRNKNVGCEARR